MTDWPSDMAFLSPHAICKYYYPFDNKAQNVNKVSIYSCLRPRVIQLELIHVYNPDAVIGYSRLIVCNKIDHNDIHM